MQYSATVGGKPTTGYTPAEAQAIAALPAAAPVIIPPLVTSDGFGGLTFQFGHTITTAIGNISIADQDAAPTKPADKAVSFSTYGVVIPISMGDRRMSGNVIQSSAIQSIMLGQYDYFVDYQIPVTTTDALLGGIQPDNNTNTDDTLQTETERKSTTTRIFQNNDNTSDNWVDVEDINDISFMNPSNLTRQFVLNNS